MKKLIFILLTPIFILNCSKNEDEVIPISVINKRLMPTEFENLNSDISIKVELKGDTLKCKVLTIYINKNDTLKSIVSEIKKNDLTIKVETGPNSNTFCLENSCWIVHEISFDLLKMKNENHTVLLGINNYYKGIDIKLNNEN